MAGRQERTILIPVVKRLPMGGLTPIPAYLRVASGRQYSFLFESAEGGSTNARYSFLGVEPRFVISAVGSKTLIEDESGIDRIPEDPIRFARSYFSKFELVRRDDLPPFLGGAVGYIGFDCIGWSEPKLRSDDAEASLMFFDSVLIFDHKNAEILIVSLSDSAGEFRSVEEARYENERLASLLHQSRSHANEPCPAFETPPVSSNFAKCDFEQAVREIQRQITDGECYQVVLSQRFERLTASQPIDIYRGLRSINPSPYMYLLQFGDRAIIGSSPETLVSARGDDLRYRPIAGTRPRGKDEADDALLAERMRKDPKEVAEHMMLVDLGRNDLGRIAKYGTVKVDRLMSVEKYSHVQHLVSELSATLDPTFDRFDVLASCFPAGTVSGAPKVKAIEVIRELELEPRGVYAGAVGYFDYGTNMDTCIAIRTIVLQDGVASVQAGAGIVADSVPELEYQETVSKAAGMLKALDAADGRSDVILDNLKTTFDRGATFDEFEAETVLNALISETDEELLRSVFLAWNAKGLDENEIYSISKIMRQRCVRVASPHRTVLDIVGTGGSKTKSFNISTAAAFIVAGADIPVAKHGNRAATSTSGSADAMFSLGISCVDAAAAERCLRETGMCFMFAPNHHRLSPALAKVRRGLGFPTIFNCVGPLCNPAGSQNQLIGAWSQDIAGKMANALARLKTGRSWVVHGTDGIDEITCAGPTIVIEVKDSATRRFEIAPEDFGVRRCSRGFAAETPESSARKIRSVLSNESDDSELRDLVLLNAAAAIRLAHDEMGLRDAILVARESIESGHALKKLHELAKETSG